MIFRRAADRWASGAVEAKGVLYWIYAGRLVVCLAVFGSALAVGDLWAPGGWRITSETRLVSLFGLAVAGVVTPLAYWHSHHGSEEPGLNFLYGQAMVDVLVVTATVHITGGSASVFPPLFYIALASGYALVVPLRSAVLVALSSGAFYLLDIGVAYPDQLGMPVLLQVAIFTAVASSTSVIGGRLRQEREKVRRLEGELHRLRLDTTDVLRTIDSAVATFDDRGRLAYMNPAAEELLETDASSWLGRDLLADMEEWAPGVARAVRRSLERGRALRNREAQVLAAGDTVPVSVSTAVLSRSEGARSVIVALQDLRPVRRLEELKLRASRLEAVAELSASLAHEIKNPLASIRSAVEQLRAPLGEMEDEEDRTLVRLVLRESDRLDRLLAKFSDFARVDVAERRPVDVRQLVEEVLEVARQHPDTPEGARFETSFEGAVEEVWGDQDLLHRTLSNLVLNAVQAAEPGRDPRVRVRVDELRPERVPAGEPLGSPLRIRVTDEGRGIEPKEIERIFDPFYTRREGGSGLGLSVAHRAVEAHGGALLVSSRPGRGATFAVVLPRRDGRGRGDDEDAPARAGAVAQQPGGGG